MILDWFHRKFLERFLYFQGESTYDCCNKQDFDNLYGHRYRYYVPQVNPIRNSIPHNVPNDDVPKDNVMKDSDSTTNKCQDTETSLVQSPNPTKPKQINRIKLFYVVPNNTQTIKAGQQGIMNDFTKQVYPAIGPCLVIPLPIQSLQSFEESEETSVMPEKESDTKPECKQLIVKDPEQPIGDRFDQENNGRSNDNEYYEPEDDFLETPFMDYMGCPMKHKAKKNGISCNADKISLERTECQSDKEDDFDDLYMNDGWSGDITFQIPATNEYFRKKLKKSPDSLNRPGVFATFLRKFLFKANLHEELSKNQW